MSAFPDQVAAAVEDAISEVLKESGGIVTALTCSVRYIDSDGQPAWITAHGRDQDPTTTLGMLRWHTLAAEQDVLKYLAGVVDE